MSARPRLARPVQTAHGEALQWELKRNCCLTPRQLGAVFASTAAVSLGIGAVFWWAGFVVIAAFAAAEVLCLAVALLVYARHAGDADTVTLDDQGGLFIEQRMGQQVRRLALHQAWARLDQPAPGSPLQLCEGQQQVLVGTHVRPLLRDQFAQELAHALRRGPRVLHRG